MSWMHTYGDSGELHKNIPYVFFAVKATLYQESVLFLSTDSARPTCSSKRRKNISTRFTAEKRIKLPTMTSNSESQFGIIIVIAFLGLPGTFFWRFSSWEKDHRGKTCDLNPFYLPVKMEKWKLGWNHGKPRFNSWNIQTKNMFQDARQKHCFFMKRLIFSWRSNELNENLRS